MRYIIRDHFEISKEKFMKVRSVNNTIVQQRKDAQSKTPQNSSMQNNSSLASSPSFKGMDPTTCLIDFWAAIARGGLAASFTVQDMLGTNFPRTFAALGRNKDLTGKNNYKAAVEVAIREFTTGPSMFIIPALVLTGATRFSKFAGEANRASVENIATFSDIMKGTMNNLQQGAFKGVDFKAMSTTEANEACGAIKEAFYTDVFKGIFAQYEDGSDINVKEYVDLMMKAEHPDTPKRNFFMSMFNKKVAVLGKQVDSKDEVISQLSTKFVADKKAHTKGWGNFLSAKITPDTKALGINAIVDDMKNFSTDFARQYVSAQRKDALQGGKIVLEKFINNFRDMRMGSRFMTNVLMVLATGMFMSIIPKLYTRNKTNPETDAIYEHVNQQRKGAKQ